METFVIMEGWIKIYRSILKWEWYSDTNTFRLFIHLLLTANHEDKKWRGIMVKRGQLITSIANLGKSITCSQRTIRTCITKLKTTGEIASKATNSFTIITVCNYDHYQDMEFLFDKPSDKRSDKRPTNDRQTTDKRPTTNNKDKNIRKKESKEEKNISLYDLSFCSDLFRPIWLEWITFKKELGKPYKTMKGMQTKYNDLVKMSGNDPLVALEIIKQSIGNEWEGLFPLKINAKLSLLPGEDPVQKGIRQVKEAEDALRIISNIKT